LFRKFASRLFRIRPAKANVLAGFYFFRETIFREAPWPTCGASPEAVVSTSPVNPSISPGFAILTPRWPPGYVVQDKICETDQFFGGSFD
jgi:hypothetical protein